MAKKTDQSVELLKLLRGKQVASGLYIVTANTETPPTFIFEGSSQPIDQELFEIPTSLVIEKGARYFALPIISRDKSQRWGLIAKLDGKAYQATFATGDQRTVTVENGLIKKVE